MRHFPFYTNDLVLFIVIGAREIEMFYLSKKETKSDGENFYCGRSCVLYYNT